MSLVVFDIGKTNAKFVVLDNFGTIMLERNLKNSVTCTAPYPHVDTEMLWQWLLLNLLEARALQPTKIMVVAHGATAAVMRGTELVLPILDYEMPLEDIDDYPRPDFSQTASPLLPNGLNLGRQLFWQAKHFPQAFSSSAAILLYPQYWAMRLSGILSSEVSSLGCHTDLWNPYQQQYSSLAQHNAWKFPPIRRAWEVLGNLAPNVALELGYDCAVYCGVHDSNASLVPYLQHPDSSVVSSGTWVVSMVSGGQAKLLEQHDMLCNCNVLGQPVPTARFMGGREFAVILGETTPTISDWEYVQKIVSDSFFILPDLSFYPTRPESSKNRYALASVYCALRIDQQLTWLGSSQNIYFEGSFAQNPWIAGILAALRPHQAVFTSSQTSGTTQGAFILANWHNQPSQLERQPVPAAPIVGLAAYQQQWQSLAEQS